MNHNIWVVLWLKENYWIVHDLVVLCCHYLLCVFIPFYKTVCMAPDVLSAVKKENTIMAENVNHATAPVQHVQVPH